MGLNKSTEQGELVKFATDISQNHPDPPPPSRKVWLLDNLADSMCQTLGSTQAKPTSLKLKYVLGLLLWSIISQESKAPVIWLKPVKG